MSGFRFGLFPNRAPETPTAEPEARPAVTSTGPAPADTWMGRSGKSYDPMAPVAARPPVIALTGGPCGGKTSLLERLRATPLAGARVVPVCELATSVMASGLSFAAANADTDRRSLERDVVSAQIALENIACRLALARPEPTVVVCDRGALDEAVYCAPGLWQHILADHGVTEAQLCQRYDFVLHVTSVAVDKPELYNNANNAARSETVREAAALDATTAEAWAAHPNRHVLSNDFPSFEAKLAEGERLLAAFVRSYHAAPSSRAA